MISFCAERIHHLLQEMTAWIWRLFVDHVKPILRFGVFSLIGLTLDMMIFHTLVTLTGWIVFANIISAFTAISFVYVTSSKYLFVQAKISYGKYVIYVLYQIVSVSVFSHLIVWVHDVSGLHPTVSKALTVPLSFLTNYIFMHLLMTFGHNRQR